MKTLLMICLLLMTSVCQAQVRAVPAGSAEALDRLDKYRDSLRGDRNPLSKDKIAQATEENKRALAKNAALVMGKEFFGTGVGWEDTNYDGTLAPKAVKAYKIDDWGFTRAIFRVLQVMDEFSLLVVSLDEGEAVVINGFSTTRVKDDAEFILPHPVVITRTWSYETTAGGKKTVLVLDRDDKSVENRIAIAKEKQEHERLLQEVMKDKNKIIAEYIKPGAIGTAAYDEFPSSIRERLVREWQEKFDALAKAIEDSEALLRNATLKNAKNNQNKKISALRAELGKHRLNRPPYVTPETLLILVAMK